MLNYLWGAMLIIGIVYAAFSGNLGAMGDGLLDASKEAIDLCVVMLGVVGFWNGLMEIAKDAGLIDKLTKAIKPILRFLFPGVPEGDPVQEDIATNMIANMLGLGWAATPSGLKAMQGLERLKQLGGAYGADAASNDMCMFLIINISSLQLIPMNMIAYRSQYGSVSSTVIVGPALIATGVSTLAAVLFGLARQRLYSDSGG
ncbi:MAG: nucleoside recognition protein [Lachnospiraceae bacterium]|nr:nucleoside recognition protein [Lachnospiraceae bacterium]